MEDSKKTLSHYQLAASQQKQKEAKDAKYREKSKKRLSNILTTKIKTSFIGAISSCEKGFGFIWGHGKDEDELTEQELAMREVWEEVRTEILDNGNTQLRAATNEVENYSINWDRYSINLNINEENI